MIIQKGEALVIRVTNMTADLRAEELEMRLIDMDENIWSSLRNLLKDVARVDLFIGSDLEQLHESGSVHHNFASSVIKLLHKN